jgi:hypothetical protein
MVLPFAACSKAAWTILSLSESRELVASSRRRIWGLRMRARAMETRCFWPPERETPREPMLVL